MLKTVSMHEITLETAMSMKAHRTTCIMNSSDELSNPYSLTLMRAGISSIVWHEAWLVI